MFLAVWSGSGFGLHVDFRYEVIGVAWGDDVVSVFCFYEDAVAVVCYCHECSSEAWQVVVSAVEAGSEKSDAEGNQRSLRRRDGFEWDGFGAADDA